MAEDLGRATRAIVERVTAELGPVAWCWEEPAHVAVHVIAPSLERPYYTLFTIGASSRAMPVPAEVEAPRSIELTLCLPPTWFAAGYEPPLSDPTRAWPLTLLRTLGGFAQRHDTWLGAGHTIANESDDDDAPQPYSNRTRLCCALLGAPVLWPPDLRTVAIDGDAVAFLGVIPIHRAELVIKLELGGAQLWTDLRRRGATELLEPDRPIEPPLARGPHDDELDARSRFAALAGIAPRQSRTFSGFDEYPVGSMPRARSTGRYTVVTASPEGSGEVVGLPHARTLEAYGAMTILRELWTVKSGDAMGRERLLASIRAGAPQLEPDLPRSAEVLAVALGAVGLETDLRAEHPSLRVVTPAEIRARSHGEVRLAETLDAEDAAVAGGLLCPAIFGEGDERFRRFGHIELARPVAHPWFRSLAAHETSVVLDVLPVAPAGIRPIVPLGDGRYATSDLNDLYREVITANAALALARDDEAARAALEAAVRALMCNGVDGTFTTIEERPLHSLDRTIANALRTTHRRVDFSGAAIVGARPALPLTQCALPEVIAAELFAPFIDAEVAMSGTSREAALRALVEERQHPILVTPSQWWLAEQPMFACTAVLTDEPTLGLAPELIDALGIFEGDAASVHVPLTPEAITEARELFYADDLPEPMLDEGVCWLGRAAHEELIDTLVRTALGRDRARVEDLQSRLLLGLISRRA